MPKYTYVLNADQRTSGYGGKWLNLDVPVTVTAEDFEAAKAEALRVLSPGRSDTNGWNVWITSITAYEEPWPPPSEIHELAFEPQARKKLRLKGVR